MASRSRAPRRATSSPPAITRCSCSTAKGTAWQRNCASGNVHSAEGWEELLLPEIRRQQQQGKEVVFRADAAFAKPELYAALEARNVNYAIRLLSNDNLKRHVAKLLTRPVGRPSYKPVVRLKSFLYQAASQLDDRAAGGGEGRVPLRRV